MAITCPGCSTQNIDGARFCRTCGTVLRPPSPSAPTSVVDSVPFQPNYPPPYQSPNQYPGANPTSSMQPISTAPNYGTMFQQSYNPLFASQHAYSMASFGSRLVAYIVDHILFILFVCPTYIYMAIQNEGRRGGDPMGVLLFMGALLIHFVYWLINVYLLGETGASVGKKLMGIKCLGPTGQPLGFGKAFLREFVKSAMDNVCLIMLLVDNLWMLGDLEQQTLHDKTVGTHVFKV